MGQGSGSPAGPGQRRWDARLCLLRATAAVRSHCRRAPSRAADDRVPVSRCAEDAPLAGAAPSFLSVGGSSSSGGVGLPKPPRSRSQLPPVPSGVSLSPGESQTFASPQRLAPVANGGTPAAGLAGADAAAAEDAADEAELAGRPSVLRRLFQRRSSVWRGGSVSGVDPLSLPGGGGAGGIPESSSVSMFSAGSVGPFSASLAELSSAWGPSGLRL